MKLDPMLCDVMFVHSGDGIGHHSFAACLNTYIQMKRKRWNRKQNDLKGRRRTLNQSTSLNWTRRSKNEY